MTTTRHTHTPTDDPEEEPSDDDPENDPLDPPMEPEQVAEQFPDQFDDPGEDRILRMLSIDPSWHLIRAKNGELTLFGNGPVAAWTSDASWESWTCRMERQQSRKRVSSRPLKRAACSQ